MYVGRLVERRERTGSQKRTGETSQARMCGLPRCSGDSAQAPAHTVSFLLKFTSHQRRRRCPSRPTLSLQTPLSCHVRSSPGRRPVGLNPPALALGSVPSPGSGSLLLAPISAPSDVRADPWSDWRLALSPASSYSSYAGSFLSDSNKIFPDSNESILLLQQRRPL